MPKPVCVKCQRFYRPKKNGYIITEMMPKDGFLVPPGTEAPERWQPYKLWRGDLWHCLGCGHEIVVGFAGHPMAEHYQSDFKEHFKSSQSVINDC